MTKVENFRKSSFAIHKKSARSLSSLPQITVILDGRLNRCLFS